MNRKLTPPQYALQTYIIVANITQPQYYVYSNDLVSWLSLLDFQCLHDAIFN